MIERNEAYYQKFPEDAERVKRIIQYLQQNKPRLGAGVLTAERFQQIGITFGVHGLCFSKIYALLVWLTNSRWSG